MDHGGSPSPRKTNALTAVCCVVIASSRALEQGGEEREVRGIVVAVDAQHDQKFNSQHVIW